MLAFPISAMPYLEELATLYSGEKGNAILPRYNSQAQERSNTTEG